MKLQNKVNLRNTSVTNKGTLDVEVSSENDKVLLIESKNVLASII